MTGRRVSATALALVTAAGVLIAAPAASASPSLADAKKQAAELSRQVDKLTTEAEVASENFNAAQEGLGKAVTSYLGVQADLEAARASDGAGQAMLSSQATALYEAGGPAPLYAEALNGSDLGDVVERMSMAGNVLRSQQLTFAHASGQTAALATLNAKLAQAATNRSQLEASASRNALLVRRLLAQQSQLLSSANDHVKAVVVELQQEAEKKAAAKFEAELLRAQAVAQAQAALVGTATPPTAAAGAAVAAATSREGTPYVWGATGPGAFDCSGLTGWAYAQAGVPLPRTSREQWFVGHHVGLAELQPGDLLFWATDPNNPATIHHVAIYAGNGYMIAAPHSGASVSLQRVYLNGYVGATRPTG
ncbi:MAG: peptidoglycan DL-endopeptidase CwlO [Frankiales bacterium]|nr:peptidoglycan DL-endopeptidase CwlO [Frankiales bacterium]